MSPIIFSLLYIIYSKSIPIICAQEEYNTNSYYDEALVFFDIDDIVQFTEHIIVNMSDYIEYNKKLTSVLIKAANDERYEDKAQSYKGYVETSELLDDILNSPNTTVYDYTHSITLLFNQVFFRQDIYNFENMCNYIGNVSNHTSGSYMETYNPDKWIKRLNDLDKLYPIENLPFDFYYFAQNMTDMKLLEKNANCNRKIAYNIQLLQLYQYLAQIERERFIMTAAAYQIKYGCHESNSTSILYDQQRWLILRTQSYMMTVKELMKIAPREICLYNSQIQKNAQYIKADDDYRMSLIPVVSDINKNEIITAVSFATEKKFIYPRIQTSVLSSKGYVRSKKESLKYDWVKEADYSNLTYGLDYISFNSNQLQIRRINLNDIYVDDGYVVTGVKFSMVLNLVEHNIADGAVGVPIRLEVRATKFDFETGKLGESKWISGEIPREQWSEVEVNNQSNGLSLSKKFCDTVCRHYVKFKKTQWKITGEKVIAPFFDGRSSTILYTYPLGGIGLYYHDAPESIGYISFKLISYDPFIYMKENISFASDRERINI